MGEILHSGGAQRSWGCPLPGRAQGQVGRGWEQPGLGEGVPARGMGVGWGVCQVPSHPNRSGVLNSDRTSRSRSRDEDPCCPLLLCPDRATQRNRGEKFSLPETAEGLWKRFTAQERGQRGQKAPSHALERPGGRCWQLPTELCAPPAGSSHRIPASTHELTQDIGILFPMDRC